MNKKEGKIADFLEEEPAKSCPVCGASNPDEGPKCGSCDADLTEDPGEQKKNEVDILVEQLGKLPA